MINQTVIFESLFVLFSWLRYYIFPTLPSFPIQRNPSYQNTLLLTPLFYICTLSRSTSTSAPTNTHTSNPLTPKPKTELARHNPQHPTLPLLRVLRRTIGILPLHHAPRCTILHPPTSTSDQTRHQANFLCNGTTTGDIVEFVAGAATGYYEL